MILSLYNNPIRTKTGLTLSIDNVVLNLYVSNPTARDQLMDLLAKLPISHAVEVVHWSSFRPGTFREQFVNRFQDRNSFWIGAVLNGRKPEWGRVRMDFNPNKVSTHEVFKLLHEYLVKNTRPMHRTVKRYDLAIDIPVRRADFFLVKDNRAYLERRHGQEWTQYLGAKSSTVGRVKLYNKQAEARLNYPLTRLEITLDPATPYEKLPWPKVYHISNQQIGIEELSINNTERYILTALLAGVGSTKDLCRKTREKITRLLEQYVTEVQITPLEYERILAQVRGYTTGQALTEPTDKDQAPRKAPETPAWVTEAEQAERMDLS